MKPVPSIISADTASAPVVTARTAARVTSATISPRMPSAAARIFPAGGAEQTHRKGGSPAGGDRLLEPAGTPTQGQYLAFIDAYTRVNLRPPAEADIQRRCGVTPPSVHKMILALERSGLIRRQPDMPRSIEVLVPPEQRY